MRNVNFADSADTLHGKTCRFEWIVQYHLCWKKSPDMSQEHILLTRLIMVGNFVENIRPENSGQKGF